MTTMVYVIAVTLLCGLLVLASYVERLYTESGKFLSREFQENIEAFEKLVEPRLVSTSTRAALAFAVLAQLTTAAIALLIGRLIFGDPKWTWPEIVQAMVAIILVVVVCNRLFPYMLFTRTRGEWLVRFVPILQVLIWMLLPVTIILGFALSVAALAKSHEPEEPEHPSEAVDALIEAGQEEGILEEGDRELIQSVVEFGDKTVREVMTPRPEIFSVAAETSIEEFTKLLHKKPFSRVPVYASSIDDILGMVLAHDLIQIPDDQAKTTTVRKLLRPVIFVPETKKTAALLREMQRGNIHMAIVIDEYGAVAGIVTLEDLVEEIVGEIRDEHDDSSDMVREADSSYVVQGNVDVGRIRDIFDVRLESDDATTVGGLVSSLVGRIPRAGEVIEDGDLRFEVLESTDRRIEKLRVSRRPAPARAKEMSA
ncbi:MAG TPA: hemolysin family protein [Verrucomicrobiae bacterium]|jgi:putative hemolysin|nr:hemolysin family protein [Verrucomicrobiae bacterium]